MPARRLPPVLRSPLHRVPVRWSLYRPLLRAARSVDLELPEQAATALSAYIKNGFRQNRRLGAIEPVRRKLREAEQVLKQLEAARHSDVEKSRVGQLAAYLAAREALRPPPPERTATSRAKAPSVKPRVYPSILHASQFYHPVPRLRPQPIEMTMTIFNRRRTSQRRFDKVERAKEFVRLARSEEDFERRLAPAGGRAAKKGKDEGGFAGEWQAWIKEAGEREKREIARSNLRIPDELREKAREANRSRERRRAQAAAARRAAASNT